MAEIFLDDARHPRILRDAEGATGAGGKGVNLTVLGVGVEWKVECRETEDEGKWTGEVLVR